MKNPSEKYLRLIPLGKNDDFIALFQSSFEEFVAKTEEVYTREEGAGAVTGCNAFLKFMSHKKSGDTALHTAATHGNLEILRLRKEKRIRRIDWMS